MVLSTLMMAFPLEFVETSFLPLAACLSTKETLPVDQPSLTSTRKKISPSRCESTPRRVVHICVKPPTIEERHACILTERYIDRMNPEQLTEGKDDEGSPPHGDRRSGSTSRLKDGGTLCSWMSVGVSPRVSLVSKSTNLLFMEVAQCVSWGSI